VTVNLIGTTCPAEWSNMNAFVVSVSESPFEGRTEIAFGLPDHLALREWADLMRFQNRWRTRDELAARDTPVDDVPSERMMPYLTRRDLDGKWVLRVTPGEVGDGLSSQVPKWLETSFKLDDEVEFEDIEQLLTIGRTLEVFLFVEFTPTAVLFGFVDDDSNTVNEYLGTGAGEITDARIRFVATNPTAPDVNALAGTVTPGRYYFKLAKVVWDLADPSPSIVPTRHGNLQLLHSPPERMYLIAETPEE
jgi:hypothetical protein